MNLEKIVEDAVNEPERLWGDNSRQANKLKKRVNILQADYGLRKDIIPDLILSTARSRVSNKSKTVYFPNIGSSGSHLIQEAVSRSWLSIPLGEVYIPPMLVPAVKEFSENDRFVFMEAWHLLHAMRFSQLFNLEAVVINTVHNPTLGRFSDWTVNYEACLITRNPLDIVISRTFRKDDYRNYISKSESDEEYLYRNIDLVNNFYSRALKVGYKNRVAFEDIFSDSIEVSRTVQKVLSGVPKVKDFNEALTKSIQDGEATNQFSGTPRKVPALYKEMARKELCGIAASLGYENG